MTQVIETILTGTGEQDTYEALEAHPGLGIGRPEITPAGAAPLVDKAVTNRFKPAVVARVLEAVALGLPKTTAYQLAGVSFQAVQRWITKGEKIIAEADAKDRELSLDPETEDAYAWFVYRLAEAEALAQEVLLRRIREAGEDPKNWAANAWLLERTHPDLYGRQKLEHTGPNGGPIQVAHAGPPQIIEVKLHVDSGAITQPNQLEPGEDQDGQ
jgi:hypothetical protein